MIISWLFSFLFISPAFACSIFMQPQTGLVAKNFDWSMGTGELMVRPVGAIKKALVSNKTWQSLYGSITFNQFGPDLPLGGINTQGLLMEALILGSTKHRPLTNAEMKEALNESEFIQYSLDNFKTVEEVIAHLNEIKIKMVYLPVHYFTCDQTKKCATIEYIGGESVVHYSQALDPAILTNLAYKDLVQTYSQNLPMTADGFASHKRFKAIAQFPLKDYSKNSMLEKLGTAKISGMTVWQMIYSPIKKSLDLWHAFSATAVSLDLGKINFNCSREIDLLNFEDKDQFFSHKNIREKILKRMMSLENVDPNAIQALKKQTLQNNCIKF